MGDPTDEATGRESARGDRPATVFDRIFPGPGRNDPELRARLESIARTARQRASERQGGHGERRPGADAGEPRATPASDAVVEALHEQTEVLRGLLDAEIAVRDDARATAQNSRTFAIAGIVIAFFTMVAAVVTVVVPLLG